MAIYPASRTNNARAICPAIGMRMAYYVRLGVRLTFVILSSVAQGGARLIRSLIFNFKITTEFGDINVCDKFCSFQNLTTAYESMNFKE